MCIFCKIINNEIPSYKVYEDDDVLAILDITQTTNGHTLIMPKKHYANFIEADEETIYKCMCVIKKLTALYQTKLNPEGYNILNNTNEVAGQSVNHLHFHLIPRYNENDELTLSFNRKSEFDIANIYKKIA